MAQDGEPPKSVDKGKGKAVDGEPGKAEEVKKDKDGKPLMNGKAEEVKIGGTVTALICGILLMDLSSARRAQ
jgi:26S proteasome regulatory subunit N1